MNIKRDNKLRKETEKAKASPCKEWIQQKHPDPQSQHAYMS